jgi:hypothetical protein
MQPGNMLQLEVVAGGSSDKGKFHTACVQPAGFEAQRA